ncbi:MAG: hypothetical protein HN348_08330 [Proteobacteria bacterium]|jgi:hypothetical protein|nr:hypothetical protein [Pseudomonadota bacterium]
MKTALFVFLVGVFAHTNRAWAAAPEHRPLLATEDSEVFAGGDGSVSMSYGLQSALFLGQPQGVHFGEVKVRAGLFDKDWQGYPHGVDVSLALMISETDFKTGSIPMGTFDVRMQVARQKGFLPHIALGFSSTLANRYHSFFAFTPVATWEFGKDLVRSRILLGGQLGLAVEPLPRQVTKGPFALVDMTVAWSLAVWRLELVTEYGGTIELGYLAVGLNSYVHDSICLTIGGRSNLLLGENKGATSPNVFAGASWAF